MPTNTLDAVISTNGSAIYSNDNSVADIHTRLSDSLPNSRTARSMSQTLAEAPPAEASTCTYKCAHVHVNLSCMMAYDAIATPWQHCLRGYNIITVRDSLWYAHTLYTM